MTPVDPFVADWLPACVSPKCNGGFVFAFEQTNRLIRGVEGFNSGWPASQNETDAA
jgi:hypothetical protein